MTISLSPDTIITERSTVDLFDYLGMLGGLYEMLKFILGTFSVVFASKRLQALLANRLYHVTLSKDVDRL